MRAPRNHVSRGPMTAEQGANLIRKVDRLLVLVRRVVRAVEPKAKRKGRAA